MKNSESSERRLLVIQECVDECVEVRTAPGCPETPISTFDILNLLARQPGKKNPVEIRACRIEFARMLDGTHAREVQTGRRRGVGRAAQLTRH